MTMMINILVSAMAGQALIAESPMAIDGRFEDWASTTPVIVDPMDAPDAFVDIGEVRVAADDHYLYLLVDFGRTVNAQGLDGTLDVVFNADGDTSTGRTLHGVEGADFMLRCTPPNEQRPDRPGRGMAISSTTYIHDPADVNRPALNAYDIGLVFAPTHSGRRMEFRIERGQPSRITPEDALPPLFSGRSFSAKLVFHALDGSLADETELFTYALPLRNDITLRQPLDEHQPTDPLKRLDASSLRVLSWNAELGAIISRSEPYVRTLKALNPDVILLQELTNKMTHDELKAVLQHLGEPPDTWTIVIGSGGGDLRCAVLSRYPIEHIESLDLVTYPGQPERSVRIASALIRANGKNLLAVAVHLKCCGRDGSSEDVTRLAEVALIHNAVRKTMELRSIDGLIIAGDFNLVGSRSPLEDMMTGLDIDMSNLGIVNAYQLDGRSNATWSDRRQPFMPGRLDWALYSDSSLSIDRCFVYESSLLAPAWHGAHGTLADDSASASDHLPIVFDVSWK